MDVWNATDFTVVDPEPFDEPEIVMPSGGSHYVTVGKQEVEPFLKAGSCFLASSREEFDGLAQYLDQAFAVGFRMLEIKAGFGKAREQPEKGHLAVRCSESMQK